MSLEKKGQKCAVCHAYLFEEDDVVYCPECGAPHHRDCYAAYGHCGLESLHGTDRQYDRAEAQRAAEEADAGRHEAEQTAKTGQGNAAVRCRMCGAEYSGGEGRCPHCGTPNIPFPGGDLFDLLGGVPADMQLAENVTASEAGRFVAVNTRRYIPKFAAMTTGKKVSWNWLAFLFPSGWLLSRKMYLAGVLTGVLTIAFTLLSLPLSLQLAAMGISNTANSQTLFQMILDSMSAASAPVIAAALGGLLQMAMCFIVAAVGDYLYRNHTVARVRSIKAGDEDPDEAYRRGGGVNLWAMMIAFFALQYLPEIIAAFIQ